MASLRVRLDVGDAAAAWLAMPELGELAPGEIGGFDARGWRWSAAGWASDLFAYRDHCPVCAQTLAGARLERRLGDSAGNLILVCPHCHTRFDVRRAGVALDSDHAPGAAAGAAPRRRAQRRGAGRRRGRRP